MENNKTRYGNGYDAFIDPCTVEGVDIIYQEYNSNGIKIISPPKKTEYGTYEFVIEDIDGRLIGIGRIYDNDKYFTNSDYKK